MDNVNTSKEIIGRGMENSNAENINSMLQAINTMENHNKNLACIVTHKSPIMEFQLAMLSAHVNKFTVRFIKVDVEIDFLKGQKIEYGD